MPAISEPIARPDVIGTTFSWIRPNSCRAPARRARPAIARTAAEAAPDSGNPAGAGSGSQAAPRVRRRCAEGTGAVDGSPRLLRHEKSMSPVRGTAQPAQRRRPAALVRPSPKALVRPSPKALVRPGPEVGAAGRAGQVEQARDRRHHQRGQGQHDAGPGEPATAADPGRAGQVTARRIRLAIGLTGEQQRHRGRDRPAHERPGQQCRPRPSAKTARAFDDGAGSGSRGWRVGVVAGNVTPPS